jgi:hypothetical protein
MIVNFKVSPQALQNLTLSIKKSMSKITEKVGVQIYNAVISGEGINYPYWSGSYVSSWRITIGTPAPSGDYNIAHRPNVFQPPTHITDLAGDATFGQHIFITNNVPHAAQVELIGTPRHPDGGWHTAAHAVNQIVYGYKVGVL